MPAAGRHRAIGFALALGLGAGAVATSGPVDPGGPAAQAARQDRASAPDAATVERWLHAGRYGDGLIAIGRMLKTQAPAPPADAALTVADLAVLTALLTESRAPADLLDVEQLSPRDASAFWYFRGIMAARSAWPGGRKEPLDEARRAAGQLELLAAAPGRWSRDEVRRVSILAAVAGAQEERDELTLLLGHARTLDAQLRGAGLGDDPILPTDELAGDLWFQVFRYQDAADCYREVTRRRPERTRAWIGLARAAHEASAEDIARDAARRVLSAWAGATGLDDVKAEMAAIAR